MKNNNLSTIFILISIILFAFLMISMQIMLLVINGRIINLTNRQDKTDTSIDLIQSKLQEWDIYETEE